MRIGLLVFSLALLAPCAWAQPSPVDGPAQGFDEFARRAAEAWKADDLAEAAGLYAEAVELRPDWDEGWWYLGTALYTTGRWDEGRKAFRRFLDLKPEAGPGWALLGLCAFELERYEEARDQLERGLGLGLGGNERLVQAARRGLAFAATKTGLFELALAPLMELATSRPKSPELVAAIGLNLLRMPLLPSEIPQARRDLVRQAGEAGFLKFSLSTADPLPAFRSLVEAYPDEPWVHYLLGIALRQAQGEDSLPAFRRELEIQPDNVLAHLQVAFELLLRGDPQGARVHAERAVALAPGLFASHHVLGRALLEKGEVEEGVRELEEAARLAPESAQTQFALAQGYAKMGRQADSERARARFRELREQQMAREARSVGSPQTEPDRIGEPSLP